jgi:hydrogenase expression/formation protein HypE
MDDAVRLEHGSGGALSRELIEDVIYPPLANVLYPSLNDGTEIACSESMFMTTDTYVIDPPFFPGGNIGHLSVCGTCNDLAVSGAAPRYLSLGFVLEEGFAIASVRKILESIASSAASVGVSVVTGDTKVVPVGKGGGIYINSTGVGSKEFLGVLGPQRVEAGDRVILSGPVGAHGIAILAARENLPVGTSLKSDCTHLYPLCLSLFDLGDNLKFMRDATRGGIAAVLNEIADGLDVGIMLREADIPVDEDVAATADILGLNPLEVANEGVFVAVVSSDAAEDAMRLLARHPAGTRAAVVGSVGKDHAGKVYLETRIGGHRMVDLPRGLLLPRIC